MTAPSALKSLNSCLPAIRSRIQGYRDRRVRLTESDTIRVLVLPILEALGWDLQDVEEVRSEYRHTGSDNPVDYALFLHSTPTLFVEAKALGISLDDRKPLLQTLNYANAAGVDWCVLTNGAAWRIYKVHAPVEAEEKLFLTVLLDDPSTAIEDIAATLSLLSRDRMQARAIDALWTDWRVDRQVEAVLDTIREDDAFVRLVAKRATGLTAGEVRASLRRSGLRSFYPQVEAVMAELDKTAELEREHVSINHAEPRAIEVQPTPARAVRTRFMKTGEMVDHGLLAVGTILTIRDRPDSAATVVDGKRVEFRGELMSFNEWGCKATGWTAIQIYKWAVLPDGRLLEALREVSQ
jgi:predicted type IV restriction endonuclease